MATAHLAHLLNSHFFTFFIFFLSLHTSVHQGPIIPDWKARARRGEEEEEASIPRQPWKEKERRRWCPWEMTAATAPSDTTALWRPPNAAAATVAGATKAAAAAAERRKTSFGEFETREKSAPYTVHQNKRSNSENSSSSSILFLSLFLFLVLPL